MSGVRIVSMLAVAGIALAAASPSFANGGKGHYHSHGHSHGSVSFGFVFGSPWYYPGWYYPAYYPYYYPQPVPMRTEPTVYIERGDEKAAPAENGSQSYWYYCKEARAYHPYVKHCPGGWEKQVPTPAPGG